ncbi:hypothetical protein HA402_014939 [Bradysia odoriphaga]|nr:hypothetical protein HA402_014939 [Bradysia odoriphaga]
MYSHVAVHRSVIMSDSTNGAPEVELAKLAIDEANKSGAAESNGSSPRDGGDFKESFKVFSKFGDTKSDGKHITLSQSDKWMKQAKVIDKKITTTDTAIHFKKLKSMKLSLTDYNKFLDDLATTKKVDLAEIKNKMATCGAPGVLQVSAGKAAAAVERLTDTSKYTGSSKQRFDETGKGKGVQGRKDVVDASGYVSGYQHKDTYDKGH